MIDSWFTFIFLAIFIIVWPILFHRQFSGPRRNQGNKFRSGMSMGGIFLFIGVVIVINGVLDKRNSIESHSWPVTNGVVVHSENVVLHKSRTYYYPIIKYVYEVREKKYESSRIVYTGGKENTTTPVYSSETTNQYPIGKTVSVHYKPTRPATSILELSDDVNQLDDDIGVACIFFALSLGTVGASLFKGSAGA